MATIIYKGFFVDEWSSFLLKKAEGTKKLEKDIKGKHVTFAFRPKEGFPESLMGKTFSLMVIGYGNDGENSGFEVALPEELIPYYEGALTIHITTSISLTGSPKNTAKLVFNPITPFSITGELGYQTGKDILYS